MKKIITTTIICLICAVSFSQKNAAGNAKIAETKYMAFHSNYFINLHHFLLKKSIRYSFYRNENQKNFDTLFADIKTPVEKDAKDEMMTALKFYIDSLARKNMLFDEGLTTLKYQLQQATGFDDLKSKCKSPGTYAAMQKADKFYKKYYWDEQDKKNKAFLESKIETIKKIEDEVVSQCSKYYYYKFNGVKFRIDLTDYATFFGAYTTTEPYVSAVISSSDKKHEGTQGIEVVFHEVSHAMIDSIYKMQESVCKKMNLELDHNTWHSILFYSTGTFVKEALAKLGQQHELYMYKNKISDFNPKVKKTAEAVALHWPQYLADKANLQNTLELILKQNN